MAKTAVDDMLRSKLTEIRDEAMELSTIMEFGKPDAAAEPIWKFAQTVIEQVEALLPSAHVAVAAPAVPEVSLRVLDPRGNDLLTPRMAQVVALVAEGLCNREIAKELNLSEHTIKKYLYRIFDKLGISTRVELALYAVNNGALKA
jgi:DNA-binding NarL/FixJ family response regulator